LYEKRNYYKVQQEGTDCYSSSHEESFGYSAGYPPPVASERAGDLYVSDTGSDRRAFSREFLPGGIEKDKGQMGKRELAGNQSEAKKNRALGFPETESTMVILDTNIIIDHLRQNQKQDTLLLKIAQKISKESLAFSIISLQELYEGRSTRQREQEEYLLLTITPLKILSYTYEISQLAGEIARDREKPIEFADAAIAATAIVNGASIFTLGRKDFEDINNLEFFELR
jgi:predicted nucleic acid-binding protein